MSSQLRNHEVMGRNFDIFAYRVVGAEPDGEELHGGVLRRRKDFGDDFESGIACVAAVLMSVGSFGGKDMDVRISSIDDI